MLIVLALLVACETDTSAPGSCAVDQESGTATALVDGEEWTGGDATWTWAGSSLQINTVGNGSWWMSMIAQTTGDDVSLADAVAAGEFPIEVSLTSGGWATFYPDSGDSYSSKTGSGGELVIAEADDTTVRGCFSFEAERDGETVTVEGGTLDATGG